MTLHTFLVFKSISFSEQQKSDVEGFSGWSTATTTTTTTTTGKKGCEAQQRQQPRNTKGVARQNQN